MFMNFTKIWCNSKPFFDEYVIGVLNHFSNKNHTFRALFTISGCCYLSSEKESFKII